MSATNARARDIVLIGGSTGAIEALLTVIKQIPADFPAAIFVVVHTTSDGPGLLPRVLTRGGKLPAVHPTDGDHIYPGRIYVPPPDYHLVLGRNESVRVRRGPRENGHRPAIDPLFRSAAAEGYAPRTVAVVLSGFLDDGSAGLYVVRSRGALSIIQDPADAVAEDMPSNALYYAGADFVLPASQIGQKLTEVVAGSGKVIAMKKKEVRSAAKKMPPPRRGNGAERKTSVVENGESRSHRTVSYPGEGAGMPSVFACPECHGVLWEIKEGGAVRYRCRVGHAYSEATLNEELSTAAESALWAAMRALDEKAGMARRMADAATGPRQWAERLREQANTYATHAELLRRMILGEPPRVEEHTAPEVEEPNVAES